MQAYAEGFDILQEQGCAETARGRALRPQPRRHRRGVAARQRDLLVAARPRRPGPGRGRAACRTIDGSVADSGEGRWTIEAAIEEAVPADVLSAALYARFRSRQDHTFGEKPALGHALRVRRPRRAADRRLRPMAAASSGRAKLDPTTAEPAPPCVLVIFGAGGDLTQRLLVPALYNLAAPGCSTDISPCSASIIGALREDDFRARPDRIRRAASSPARTATVRPIGWTAPPAPG